MDNPVKLATQGTQDVEKHHTICFGHHYTEPTNRTSFFGGNRNGQHNTEPRTQRHTKGQHKEHQIWATRAPQKKPGMNTGAREGWQKISWGYRINSYVTQDDDFIFPTVNYPFICRNISTAPVYGVSINSLFERQENDIIISGVTNRI